MVIEFPRSSAPKSTPGAGLNGRRSNELMLMLGLPIAIAGLWIALLPSVLVVLALKLSDISPNAGAAASNLGLILGVGALFAMVANPLAGRLSDRTPGRFGMRRPWIVGGVAVGYVALVVIAITDSVAMMIVGWALAQIAFNSAFAALMAIMPDQVTIGKRGRLAGGIGIANNVSVVIATFLVQLFDASAYQVLVPATIGVLVVLAFALSFEDRVLAERPTDRIGLLSLLGSFAFNPKKNPDLGWAWMTRFLMVISQAVALTYLTYFLIENIGLSHEEAATGVFYATFANIVGVLSTTMLVGWLSDKLRRRKIFVLIAGLTAAAGLATIAFATTLEVVLVGEFIMGAGMGAFFAIDLALITDVLSTDKDNGKDLGVVNIAQALPQSLVPAAAPSVVMLSGGYPGLFLTGAIVGIVGAFCVTRIKKVR